MKDRTKWFKTKQTYPVRPGFYECGVLFTSAQRKLMLMNLEYVDGRGFRVPWPMVVPVWRGMTKKAHAAAMKGLT